MSAHMHCPCGQRIEGHSAVAAHRQNCLSWIESHLGHVLGALQELAEGHGQEIGWTVEQRDDVRHMWQQERDGLQKRLSIAAQVGKS